MTTGVLVCGDVMVEILAKLPVKSLLRFHCVCKTWYSLISHPQFSNNFHPMRPSVLICDNRRDFSTITMESLLKMKGRALTPLSLPWETEPIDCYSKNIWLGSCNGLVCVGQRSRSSSDFIIWNPSTRKFRRLPRPRGYSISIGYIFLTFVWFGYDESIDDYKIVRLYFSDIFTHRSKVAELDVFTLKSNTWRSSSVDHIAVTGLNLRGPATGVLSNGAIHWITNDCFRDEMCILVLDLATEKLRVLKFPHGTLNLNCRIGSLEGGCLWLCTNSFPPLVRDLWIMKEYGVGSSWTKLESFPYQFIDPILLSKEGKEMVVISTMLGGGIVKLRVEEGVKKVKNEETLLCAPTNPCASNIILHMEESLVSIFP